MAANEIHQYDLGTQFEITVKDNTTTLNVSSASVKKFEFTKPSQAKVTVAASFSGSSAGADGKLCYTTAASSFLDETGNWQLQVYLEMSTGIWHSDINSFRVYRNL